MDLIIWTEEEEILAAEFWLQSTIRTELFAPMQEVILRYRLHLEAEKELFKRLWDQDKY